MPKPPPKSNDFQSVQRAVGQGFSQIQQHPGRVQITVGLHEQRADMLIDAGQGQLMPGEQGEDFIYLSGVTPNLVSLPAVTTLA